MFDYQDKCVVLRCIPNLLPESPIRALAVEWSTDYALLGDEGRQELVSVKHRDPGQHDWTFGKLKAENVFRDLHAVWRAMGETGDFFFESNAGFEPALNPFVGNPGERDEPDGDAVRKIAACVQADIQEVRRFLQHFSLRGEPLPSRHYIDAVATEDLAGVMERLDLDPAGARKCLAALITRIATASTERPPDPSQRVTRLIGFMQDIENRAGRDPLDRLLAMDELRDIVATASTTAGARRPTSSLSTASNHPVTAHGVEALPVAAAVLDYAPVLADIGLHHFTGREWLLAAIEDAASAATAVQLPRTGGYVLVGAGAGLGKTMLAGWLSRAWDCSYHFTGVPGGQDQRVGLQSLAAQLIIRYNLHEEFAAGGILPGWAGDPARFPRILAVAAQRAREEGGHVRIVVDGLDEAAGDGIALGLPATLPEGVCIVATYREGIAPHRLPGGERVSTIKIRASDQANREDIRLFLASQVREDTVAARLSAAGITSDDFVSLLAERCAGVWVYLRYVLSQIRSELWDVADLSKLPVGLVAYYRQQVTGRRSDPTFHSEDLVVLATLAAAQQPMTLDQISRITALDISVVRMLTNYRYRPFLTVDATSPAPPRYSIYHTSLREFLQGNQDQADDPLDTSDLREASHSAHRRIADYYLEMFGELDAGLGALDAAPDLADRDDNYALRNLPIHLDRGGREDDLRALLTSHRPGSPLGSTWADAHDRAGTLDDYLAAIELARTAAERKTDRLIAAGRPAPTVAEESLYALIAANLISRSNAIPVSLLEALARSGTWDSTRALAHAMRHHEPHIRTSALIALIPTLQDPAQACRGRDNAVSAVAVIASEEIRAKLLGDLAPYLDKEQLNRALNVATAIHVDLFRARAIVPIAARLEGAVLDRALSTKKQAIENLFRISSAIGDAEQRAGAMAGAARMMEGLERARGFDRVLEAVIAIPDRWAMGRQLGLLADCLNQSQLDRAFDAAIAATSASGEILIDLAPYLTPDQLDRALATVGAITWEQERGRAVARLARHLNSEQLKRALETTSRIEDEGIRSSTQLQISHHAQVPVAGHIIESALNAASKTEDQHSRYLAFISLARHLEGPYRARALEGALHAVLAISDQDACGRALRDLARYLLPDQLDRALEAAAAISDVAGRGLALTGLARQLDEPARSRAITGALDSVAKAGRIGGQVRVELVALARELEGPARHRILQGLLELSAASFQEDDISRGLALEELAPLLDPAQLSRATEIAAAIWDDYPRDIALGSLAPHLSAAQLQRALEAATAPGAGDFQARAQAVASLARHLPGQARVNALEETLEAARTARDEKARRKMITLHDERKRADLIITVAPYLDTGQLARALRTADSFTDQGCLVSVLAALATYLDDPARTRALDKAVHTVARIESARRLGWALADLTPHLLPEVRNSLVGQAVEAAPRIPDETARADLIITLAPYLDAGQLARALRTADSFTDQGCLVSVLAALATYVEDPARTCTLERAVECFANISDGRYLVWASAHLIPHLQGAVRAKFVRKALDTASVIEEREARVRALADIAEHLEGQTRSQCLDNALDVAMSIQDERKRARALETLASHLEIGQLGRALTATTSLPYLGDYEPCQRIFWRMSSLSSGAVPADIVWLTRQFYRAFPPRDALFAVTSATAEALVYVGGSEATERLFRSITTNG